MTLHILKNIKERRKYCDEKKESLVSNKKERKEFNKISKVCMRLFDECFILKRLMKSIKIVLKK